MGLVQQAVGPDPSANLEHTIAGIREAAARGARLVCLQELFGLVLLLPARGPRLLHAGRGVPGPTTERLGVVAGELGVVIVASLFEKRAGGLYHNTAAVIDADGRYLGKYRKMHIPDDPQFYEKFYFTPGDLGFRVWDTRVGRLGVLVCWDQWYPEAARLTAMQGAEILVYPTAIGWLPSEKAEYGERQQAAWETIQRSHAVANGCFVVAVNRVGTRSASRERTGPPGIEFWGGSFVADPNGRVLVQGGRDEDHSHRRLRPGASRCRAHPLAVPARSPHRRVLRSHATLP